MIHYQYIIYMISILNSKDDTIRIINNTIPLILSITLNDPNYAEILY